MAIGFVYIWRDKGRRRFYLGSHVGSEDDGYVCGSKIMLRAYRARPHDFRRRILVRAEVQSHVEIKKIEQLYLDLIGKHEFGKKYYNISRNAYGADPELARIWMRGNTHNVGKRYSRERIEKISAAQKGRAQPEWLKKKLGNVRRGRKWYTNGNKETLSRICPEGWWIGRCNSFVKNATGRKFGKDHGQKISKAKKESNARKFAELGFIHSDETRRKISISKRRAT